MWIQSVVILVRGRHILIGIVLINQENVKLTLQLVAWVCDLRCKDAQCKSPIQIEQMVQYHPVVGTKNCKPRIGVRLVGASG